MNQRASHFTLGNTGDNPGSIYKKDYTRKAASQDKDFRFVDPFKGKSINPANQSSFSTTNNALFRDWGAVDKAALDPTKLKELRGHHFNLGSYNPDDLYTTNKHYHNRK